MAKKLLKNKVYQYTAVFEPAEKGHGYTVTIPALPGCISEGNTFEEATANIKEAASLYLEGENQNFLVTAEENSGVVVSPIKISV